MTRILQTFWLHPGIMAPAMQAEIPGIANTCRSNEGQMSLAFFDQ
jgi:hypothetical protein